MTPKVVNPALIERRYLNPANRRSASVRQLEHRSRISDAVFELETFLHELPHSAKARLCTARFDSRHQDRSSH